MTIELPGVTGVLVGPVTKTGHIETRVLRVHHRGGIAEITLTGENTGFKLVDALPALDDFAPVEWA